MCEGIMNNPLSTTLKIVGIIWGFVGTIAALIVGISLGDIPLYEKYALITAFFIFGVSLVTAMLIYAFGEGIALLSATNQSLIEERIALNAIKKSIDGNMNIDESIPKI